MASFPLFVSKYNSKPQKFEILAVRRSDLTGDQGSGRVEGKSWPLSSDTAVILESDGQTNNSAPSSTSETRSALRHEKFQRLPILAANTQEARWYIVSFLTVPKAKHEELGAMFQTYLRQIFANPKFDPVFSYLAPMAPASDVLLSVWGFGSSRDADVYMPSSEHVVFGKSVGPFIKHADFFQAALVEFRGSNL